MDYPTNNTTRLKVGYTWPIGRGHLQFRGVRDVDLADVIAAVRDVLTAAAPHLYNDLSFDSLDASAEGTDTFAPLPWTPIDGSIGSDLPANYSASYRLQFVGTSTSGAAVSFYLPGTVLQVTRRLRLTRADLAVVPAVLDALADGYSQIAAIDGHSVVWKQYGNSVYNDYLTHKARYA